MEKQFRENNHIKRERLQARKRKLEAPFRKTVKNGFDTNEHRTQQISSCTTCMSTSAVESTIHPGALLRDEHMYTCQVRTHGVGKFDCRLHTKSSTGLRNMTRVAVPQKAESAISSPWVLVISTKSLATRAAAVETI